MLSYKKLASVDPEAAKLVSAETLRQSEGLELIPSENYASQAVLEALATVYTNKYSEGYPKRRYYGGQSNTDSVETLAINRAKQLFKCDHANVQAYSGAPANLAVYFSCAKPGDTIMAMDLSHGGHLTHGSSATITSKLFNFVHYGMSNVETGAIDYNQVRELAKKHKPKIIVGGFSSYTRNINWQELAKIAQEVNAVAMADIAHIAGLIAGGVLENPLDQGFQVATSTTHKTLRGPRGGLILSNGKVSNPLKKVETNIENIPTLIDRTVFPGMQGGPHMNVILAKAVAFKEALQPQFSEYAKQTVINAQALAKALIGNGFKLITNGTDNHIVLIDTVSSFGLGGAEVESALDVIGLTVNKNVIPGDTRPPYDPSGIRLGTPAITTRGMKEPEMLQIADWVKQATQNTTNKKPLLRLASEVREFCKKYPLPS